MGPLGISLGLHALALVAGLYLLAAAPASRHQPRPALQVGALVECLAPGEEDCSREILPEETLPALDELQHPKDLLVHSSADELTTPAEVDFPPEPSEARAVTSPRPFFEVPLEAIRVRVRSAPAAESGVESEATPHLAAPISRTTRKTASRPTPAAATRVQPRRAPRVLSQPNVLNYYPLEARRRGIEGRALVLIHVNAHGRVTSARVIKSSGSSLLDRQAIRYTRAMRFHPGTGGKLQAPVHFRLS